VNFPEVNNLILGRKKVFVKAPPWMEMGTPRYLLNLPCRSREHRLMLLYFGVAILKKQRYSFMVCTAVILTQISNLERYLAVKLYDELYKVKACFYIVLQ
jgi:hypothetical protein